ncbi:MAG: thioredoxin [Desulfobulbaceae bacterium]
MSDTIVRCPACATRNRISADRSRLRPKCGRCGHYLPAGVLPLDDASFDRFVGANSLPVLVDFFSPTCGPCRMLAPVIDELADAFAGRVLVAKYDTSRHQHAASRFRITGVPTLIFFRQGREVDRIVGAAPRQEIERRLNALL